MNIAVYSGPGTGDPTREGIQAFLTHADIPWRAIGAEDVVDLDLEAFDAFYMPGGWAWPYVRDIPPEGKETLRAFVAQGGSYIGVCAGAYFAADLISWEGRFVEYDLDLYRGLAKGPIDAIAPWKGWRLTELSLTKHPVHGRQERHTALYWGGPAFDLRPSQPTTVLARYEATGGSAAVTFCRVDTARSGSGCAVRWTVEQTQERRVAVRR